MGWRSWVHCASACPGSCSCVHTIARARESSRELRLLQKRSADAASVDRYASLRRFFDSKVVGRLFDIWDRHQHWLAGWLVDDPPTLWKDLFVAHAFASDAKLCIELAITRAGVKLRAYESIPLPVSVDTVATLITSPGGDLRSNSCTSNGLLCTKQCDVTADLRHAVLTGVGVSLLWKTRVRLSPPFY